jgi:hypothetical protein
MGSRKASRSYIVSSRVPSLKKGEDNEREKKEYLIILTGFHGNYIFRKSTISFDPNNRSKKI